jgi:antitoxin PrlF
MKPLRVTIAPNGRMVLPAQLRDRLGLRDGGTMLARIENGIIQLEPLSAALMRARKTVRKYIPEGVSLSDDLIRERRQAVMEE